MRQLETFSPAEPPAALTLEPTRHLFERGRVCRLEDGGAMSNNPSINIFNLGKPSYRKTAFEVGEGVTSIRINMRYM